MEWVNYHHLLYFWTVAREGGLAPAGKVLRLSQSALSGQIKRLEETLDTKLFERRGRRLAMTDAGQLVYRYADEIFGLGREMLDVLKHRPGGRPLRLTVGIADVVPKLLVRHLLEPALRDSERVQLVCHEDRFDRLLDELAAHRLDVVITDAPVPPHAGHKAFNHPLGETTISLLAPRAQAEALRRGFPRSLDGAPLLLPLPRSTLRRALDQWFADHEVRPDVRAEAEDSALLKAFAADGMGSLFAPTVVAELVARRYDLAVVAELPELRERYYAISGERKLAHPAVRAIREAARSTLFS
jgi:LysR family transcriptional activator of nhaA